MDGADAVAASFQPLEHRIDLRMIDRPAVAVGDQILLADIGDVRRIAVFGEQVVVRLLFRRANVLGDRLIPFVTVRKDRVDRTRRRESRTSDGARYRPARNARDRSAVQ